MSCPRTPSDLGAYVLGALSPEERRHFEEHLDGCALCAAELAEFADIPALLDRVRPEDLQPVAVTPSPELFDRVSAAARATPERRRRAPGGGCWSPPPCSPCSVWGPASIVWASEPGERHRRRRRPGPCTRRWRRPGRTTGRRSTLTVAGLRPGEICRMVAVDADGERHPAGDWAVSEDGDGTWRGWADVQRDDLREVVVYGEGDRELVRLEL